MADVVRILGANWCPDCKRAKQFLADQRVPYRYIDVEQDQAAHHEVMERNGGKLIIPVIEFPDGSILIEPDNSEIAATLKLEITASKSLWDLIVVGAGPAGLTSAIYAAREGIDTLVLDKGALGGQAGATERVENYPGFPEGITGGELASRYVEHARRYGVEMLSGVQVRRISREDDGLLAVDTDQGETYRAKAVVVATGSTYRRLDVPGEEDLIGAGIHFCATCDGPFYRGAKDLVVIGGGNSGLEEGLFLSQFAEKITVLQDLPKLTASTVLQEKVANDPRFDVRTSTKVREFLAGADGRLDAVEVETPNGIERIEADGAFIFIGLTPNSGFVEGTLDLGGAGFIATRQTLETNLAGVFAAGDVREGSTKQIASAVGEGAAVALMVRAYLNSLDD
ncbi:MAG: FAD-dependent oxidoreductase [Nitrospiraceae bacterium]|nr:FAD-dependent oxidoreductase [Nitrospiraceae bacterium]